MQYSVRDLVRILLKKWWVIILAMGAVAGLSIESSRLSYEKTMHDYDRITNEVIDTGWETGSLVGEYVYDYQIEDYSEYIYPLLKKENMIKQIAKAISPDTLEAADNSNTLAMAEQVYSEITDNIVASVTDSRVMLKVQEAIDASQYLEPPTIAEWGEIVIHNEKLNVSGHVSLAIVPKDRVFTITVSGVEEPEARQIVDEYLICWTEFCRGSHRIKLDVKERFLKFYPDTLHNTELAKLAKEVMKSPTPPPSVVKTIGTAAAYAFVLTCFAVLLITFVKDTHSVIQKNEDSKV